MSRSPIVTGYTFPGTSGTHLSTINGGADWIEQNAGATGWLEVDGSNHYNNPYTNFADCCYQGTGAGSFTANQYFSVTLNGNVTTASTDALGGSVLNNGGSYTSLKCYRIYYIETNVSTPSVKCDRAGASGAATNIVSYLCSTYGTWAAGNKLSCEVTIAGGVPTFQIYQDTGSGPVAYGASFSDSGGSQLTSGTPGVTGTAGSGDITAGPWEAGILVAPGAVVDEDAEWIQFIQSVTWRDRLKFAAQKRRRTVHTLEVKEWLKRNRAA
jgi:hypothetical protein